MTDQCETLGQHNAEVSAFTTKFSLYSMIIEVL